MKRYTVWLWVDTDIREVFACVKAETEREAEWKATGLAIDAGLSVKFVAVCKRGNTPPGIARYKLNRLFRV